MKTLNLKQLFINDFRVMCTDTFKDAKECHFEALAHLHYRNIPIDSNREYYNPISDDRNEDNYFFEFFSNYSDDELIIVEKFLYRYLRYIKKNQLQPELLVDSHHGQYIPQFFAQTYNLPENFKNYDSVKEDLETLSKENSNETENYWDIWDEFLNKAIMILKGNEYYIEYSDSDLFTIPVNFNGEDFFA